MIASFGAWVIELPNIHFWVYLFHFRKPTNGIGCSPLESVFGAAGPRAIPPLTSMLSEVCCVWFKVKLKWSSCSNEVQNRVEGSKWLLELRSNFSLTSFELELSELNYCEDFVRVHGAVIQLKKWKKISFKGGCQVNRCENSDCQQNTNRSWHIFHFLHFLLMVDLLRGVFCVLPMIYGFIGGCSSARAASR